MAETMIYRTPCGLIRGGSCQRKGVRAFKGIRYANAGRFEYPRIVTHWDGVYDASSYGACSFQPRAFFDEAKVPEKTFYYHEFREGETYKYSEDCLFLNIWTPDPVRQKEHGDTPEEPFQDDRSLPVIFYIHGGGFTGGCGHEKHFDDPVWPCHGVIAVTVNYRLGPLGFACLPEAAEEAGHTGNYALYDILAALKWVRKNIAAFGGDPDNITLMGQSAGAMVVQQFCLSPRTKGLFAKAVMSSGGGVNKMLNAKPASAQYDFWNKVMAAADCHDLNSFRSLPVERLFQAWQTVKKQQNGGFGGGPVLDGRLIREPSTVALAAHHQHRIPYLIGSTSEDVMPPLLHKMAVNWCREQEIPSYAWFFDRRLPGDKNGAWHSSDLWYWFGTLDHSWRPWTDWDRKLSRFMVSYLTAFAKTGVPSVKNGPVWQDARAGNNVMHLGNTLPHMGKVNQCKLIYTMLTNKSVGE